MDMIEHITPSNRGDSVAVTMPPLDALARQWPLIEPLLRRATDRWSCYEPVDVLQRVMLGQLALWTVVEDTELVAVIVTEARQYPRCRVLEVLFVGGKGNAVQRWYQPVLDALDRQAEAAGCDHIAAFGRRGWQRMGFEITGVTLMRRLRG